MRQASFLALSTISCFIAAQAATAGGPLPPYHFLNQTATRLVSSPSLGVSDVDEKDYAWGDLDHDGDIDLVVVRKQPYTTGAPGALRPNVLFMNVNGVLTDQTAQYASTAINTPIADQGFLTPTNDRDVIVIDVDGDGWLDVVTATTISDGQPKHIGYPRVYVNQGMVGGVWGGLVFDNARIPAMLSSSIGIGGIAQTPAPGFNPRFCSVAGGDTTGDGRPELFFGDYDATGVGGFSVEPAGRDFNNKYLLNNGSGFFTDVTETRLTGTATFSQGTYNVWVSAFGAAAAIADMNGDGRNDIIYQTALTPPQYIGILYNSPVAQGFFTTNAQIGFQFPDAPYFISVADLNNDGRLDLIESDDNIDLYRLATGVSGGVTTWTGIINFPSATNGFGSQSIAADLNGDGWKDVLISDVDVDIPGCTRTADIMLNNANPPNVTFTVNSGGIPDSMLTGAFNIAVFDINNDSWNDIVVGRCTGTQVWIFDAPAPILDGDLNGDGFVNSTDLGILLASWTLPPARTCSGGSCIADLNHDNVVNSLDLGIMLTNWTL